MVETTEFVRDYIIQTRREIDNEKKERDQLLNFALLVLGAVCFSIARSEAAQKFLLTMESLFIELPALVIITTLFWVRYKKLKQIADRWFSLCHLMHQSLPASETEMFLEVVVARRLAKWSYLMKDIVLNVALCLPIYGTMFLQIYRGPRPLLNLKTYLILGVIGLHILAGLVILGRKLKDPWGCSTLPPAE